jgi:hypothetical protein
MKPRSYVGAIDAVLNPEGFGRDGRLWSRERDGILDQIDMQVSQFAGTTANVSMIDLKTRTTLLEATAPDPATSFGVVNVRIGELMDGSDRWWRKDPTGPAQLAQAIKTYALPFLDQLRPLERQALYYGRAGAKPWKHIPSQLYLAMTLYRMGDWAEARQALENPHVSTRHFPEGMARVEELKRWLDERRPSSSKDD